MSFFDEVIAPHCGHIVRMFGEDLRDRSKDDLIALIGWIWEQKERAEKRATDASVQHIHDLAAMRQRELHGFWNWVRNG